MSRPPGPGRPASAGGRPVPAAERLAPAGGRPRSVTGRALSVLGAFDAEHPRLTLSEIARRADLPLATAHRLLGELEAWRAVDRDPDGTYAVGQRIWELGLLAPVSSRLREVALPSLQELFEATRENVHLAVRDGHEALYVEKLTGYRSVPIISRLGGRLPLHATGVGKALLAFAPPAVIAEVLRRPLVRVTPHTVCDPARLARQLAEARRRGWAATAEEMSAGAHSVAVPVLGGDGWAVAAVGLVVPHGRISPRRWVTPLRSAAAVIAARLAADPGDPFPALIHDVPRPVSGHTDEAAGRGA